MRILHISDPHFTDSSRTLDGGYVIDSQNSQFKSSMLADYLIANKVQLKSSVVVITGDVTDSGDAGDYSIAKAFVKTLRDAGFEVYVVPGNHDYCAEGTLWLEAAASAELKRARFRQHVSDARYPAVIDRGSEGRLILLDTMKGELDDWEHADNWAQGRLGQDQLQRLQQAVEEFQPQRPGRKLVVCMHHSPFHTPDNDPRGCLQDGKEFLKIVGGRVDALLFGHTTNDGNLQESFPLDQVAEGITLINCENLEHGPWTAEAPLVDAANRISVRRTACDCLSAFFVGADSGIYCKTQTAPGSATWTNEVVLGGKAVQLCVEPNEDGRLEVLYLGMDSRVHRFRQLTPGGPPSHWEDDGWVRTGSARMPQTHSNCSRRAAFGLMCPTRRSSSVRLATQAADWRSSTSARISRSAITFRRGRTATGARWGRLTARPVTCAWPQMRTAGSNFSRSAPTAKSIISGSLDRTAHGPHASLSAARHGRCALV